MADLQEQLQAILGDPQAMGQITAIAQALTGGNFRNDPPAPSQMPVRDAEYVPVDSAPAQPEPPPAADLSALTGMGGLGALGDIDPKLIQAALRIFSEYSAQDDEKAALLAALKPFLKASRLEKMEKAEKIARLSRVVRVAIRFLKEGDADV